MGENRGPEVAAGKDENEVEETDSVTPNIAQICQRSAA
jgi:hypothetical protein